MTNYLTLTSTGQIDQWPITESDIFAAHPHTSFPVPLNPADVAGLGYIAVQSSAVPDHSPDTHTATEQSPAPGTEAGTWVQSWRISPRPESEVSASLTTLKEGAKRQIDADIDGVIAAVVGQRTQEHLTSETQALAYIAAEYTGTVPDYVAADAQANSQTASWAADRIAATASAWRIAQLNMRTQRLTHKARIDAATTHALVRDVQADWSSVLQALRESLQ